MRDKETCMVELPLKECFKIEDAVCNHGYFMMAPNVWIPSNNTLQRPLRLADGTTSLTISISQPSHRNSLLLKVNGTNHLSLPDTHAILDQVSRMLRLSMKDEVDVRKFQNIHSEAKMRGFGRLFRSPTLFEDAVKSILLCNCTWERSLKMAQALCVLQFKLVNGHISKRKRSSISSEKAATLGNFPTWKELVSLSEKTLEEHCKLGYRAFRILEFARKIKSGKIQLRKLEEIGEPEILYRELMKIKGFGPFTCANIMMCIGFYERVPIDAETLGLLKEVHSRKDCKKATVEAITEEVYGKYVPYQCLVYWLELVEYYESKIGKLSELPSINYAMVTSTRINSTH